MSRATYTAARRAYRDALHGYRSSRELSVAMNVPRRPKGCGKPMPPWQDPLVIRRDDRRSLAARKVVLMHAVALQERESALAGRLVRLRAVDAARADVARLRQALHNRPRAFPVPLPGRDIWALLGELLALSARVAA